ncbi:MAG: RNA polymerase-binding protein RbpA [Bifidobacteriaceae bacterium]|jgi:hypothetical protein|nr:RNA polymerase-binding protein RbpA [Bifidobacteriaceae bacterium]
MADRSLRGSGIGFQSLESEDGVEFAERQETVYDCPEGHTTILPFALDAEIPSVWQCRCGLTAVLRDAVDPIMPKVRRPRSHWDMLLERRSLEELEELLEEHLVRLRRRRVSKRTPVAA